MDSRNHPIRNGTWKDFCKTQFPTFWVCKRVQGDGQTGSIVVLYITIKKRYGNKGLAGKLVETEERNFRQSIWLTCR